MNIFSAQHILDASSRPELEGGKNDPNVDKPLSALSSSAERLDAGIEIVLSART